MNQHLPILSLLIFLLLVSCQSSNPIRSPLQILITQYETDNEALEAQYQKAWPDLSKEAVASREQVLKDYLAQLKEIEPILAEGEQINHALLTLILQNELSQSQAQAFYLPLNSEGGFLTEIYYSVSGSKINTEEEAAHYIAKIKALPDYLDSQQKRMQAGLASQKTVPALIVERCLSLLAENLESEAYFELFLDPLSGNDWADQRAVLKPYVNTALPEAYRSFQAFLEEVYLPQTRQSIGISEITDGKAYYEQRVRYFTTLDISPDSVFAIGEAEVKRIRTEMDSILISLAWKGDFVEFLQFLRTDKQFYPQSPAALLERAAWLSKKAEGFLPKYFGFLPRMPFTVEPVPAAIAPNYTGGRYSEGSYENHTPGAYWVNTYRLETRPFYVLPALTLHEAVPGHHTQIMLAQELENVPKFRQQQYLSAFGEGWALYAEYLGKEAGMYETPYEHFGALTYEMWRACRLVVDVGIHYKGWTREQAVRLMAENTALSLHEVNTEIDRYIGWPGQALSYKMGELTIRALREEAEEALEEQFDIRAFHDLVLAEGSIPMETLKRRVREWIAKEGLNV